MKGGKIGEFPKFDAKVIPGGALNLYDPFGFHKNRSEEAKANGLATMWFYGCVDDAAEIIPNGIWGGTSGYIFDWLCFECG